MDIDAWASGASRVLEKGSRVPASCGVRRDIGRKISKGKTGQKGALDCGEWTGGWAGNAWREGGTEQPSGSMSTEWKVPELEVKCFDTWSSWSASESWNAGIRATWCRSG